MNEVYASVWKMAERERMHEITFLSCFHNENVSDRMACSLAFFILTNTNYGECVLKIDVMDL